MITGIVMTVGGLVLGFYGATAFNFGWMMTGWCIAGIGLAVFISHIFAMP